jgi:ribosome-associated protein
VSSSEAFLQVAPGCAIPLDELAERFGPSGGPGGQHANRSNTRVELRFDVAASAALTDWQRSRLVDKLGPEVRVVADDERSQARNRALAQQRLAAVLAEALHVPRPRRATRPSRAARQRRLDAKRVQSERKRSRRRPPAE